MTSFEDQLWSDLASEHGDRMRASATQTAALAASMTRPRPSRGGRDRHPRRVRRAAIVSGTALATAGATTVAVLALSASSAPPAFAVTDNSDGSVTVTLRDISALSGLNAEFARRGIDAAAVPLTSTCPIHHFPHYMPAGTNPDTYTITVVPSQIPAGYTAVVAATQTADGKVELLQGAVHSPAPACFNSAVRMLHPLQVPIPSTVKLQVHKAGQQVQVRTVTSR